MDETRHVALACSRDMTTSFEELTDSYKCIFFDAFGVLKSSSGVYAGVLERLVELQERGKEIFIVTNDSSKSPEKMALGYSLPHRGPTVSVDRIITSGLLATEYLMNKVRSGWVTYLGTESSAHYIERAGLQPVPVSELVGDHSPRALVLLDDEGFDWYRDINAAINLVRQSNIPVILANKDLTYPVNDTEVGVAIGGVASLMEQALGRNFIGFGKPDPMVFAYAFSQARLRNINLQKRDVLMVGDTLTTDIVGANKFGIDSALVLSGTTSPGTHLARIAATGIVPNYICESILT